MLVPPVGPQAGTPSPLATTDPPPPARRAPTYSDYSERGSTRSTQRRPARNTRPRHRTRPRPSPANPPTERQPLRWRRGARGTPDAGVFTDPDRTITTLPNTRHVGAGRRSVGTGHNTNFSSELDLVLIRRHRDNVNLGRKGERRSHLPGAADGQGQVAWKPLGERCATKLCACAEAAARSSTRASLTDYRRFGPIRA
jgi:hypothetical protein